MKIMQKKNNHCIDCEESFILKDYPKHLVYYVELGEFFCPDCAYEDSILTYEEKWDLEEAYCS